MYAFTSGINLESSFGSQQGPLQQCSAKLLHCSAVRLNSVNCGYLLHCSLAVLAALRVTAALQCGSYCCTSTNWADCSISSACMDMGQ